MIIVIFVVCNLLWSACFGVLGGWCEVSPFLFIFIASYCHYLVSSCVTGTWLIMRQSGCNRDHQIGIFCNGGLIHLTGRFDLWSWDATGFNLLVAQFIFPGMAYSIRGDGFTGDGWWGSC